MLRILIVDDEENILKALHRVLTGYAYSISRCGLAVDTFASPVEALGTARHVTYHLAIADQRMPEMNGTEFLSALKGLQPLAARILMSGHMDMETLMGAINGAHIFRVIEKPWNNNEIMGAVAQSLSYNQLLLENQQLADQVRVQKRRLRAQELELQRLERECPGITKVNWAQDGSIVVHDEVRS